jgi:HAE1 family hydrophobic/amphiphilic exporter-1
MLTGILTKTATLLMGYKIMLRQRCVSREESLLKKTGPVRLRPILMTTTAVVFGMSQTSLKRCESAGSRTPMAIAVIGGLITSMSLTLVVLLIVYTLRDERVKYLRKERENGHRKSVTKRLSSSGCINCLNHTQMSRTF